MVYKKRKILIIVIPVFIVLIFLILFIQSYLGVKKYENVQSLSDFDVKNMEKEFSKSVLKPNVLLNVNNNGVVEIDFKFLNLFRIKKIKKQFYHEKQVYLGGNVFDFNLKIEGVIVKEFEDVNTINGKMNPLKNSNISVGDTITAINNEAILDCEDFIKKIENSEGSIKLSFINNGKLLEKIVSPAIDKFGHRKLGVWVKDDTQGTGTISFIETKTNNFVALGHNILDFETGGEIVVSNGTVKNCCVVGVKKSKRGLVGEIKTISKNYTNSIGRVVGNTKNGLRGEILNKSVYEGKQQLKIASALETKIGKAQIYCCLINNDAKLYDIEIVKIENHNKEKNILIKIVDEELLSLAGGIVQGMSGSPIIQNDKVVGVLTHCFINDPTRGFAILACNVI